MTEHSDFATMAKKAMEDAIDKRGQINVLIAGRSGVGKSTLINAIFQGNLAETGQGRPVTKTTREITKEGIPLAVWDTRGLEMAAYKETIADLERLISDRAKERDPSRHIHVAYLCIHEDGRRVEEAEIELHYALSKHMPVIGVITKSRSDQGFRAEVQELLPETRNVIRVRALAEQFDEGHSLPPMGLAELAEMTAEVIPEGLRCAFAAAQKASIQAKKNVSHGVVATAAALAASAGAVPIPLSDSFLLIPIQVGMLAGISVAFGLELSNAFLSTLVVGLAGSTGATVAGRMIVANLFKCIPSVGSVVGGAISASTATALTVALGELYITTLDALFTQSGGDMPDSDTILTEFRRRLELNHA